MRPIRLAQAHVLLSLFICSSGLAQQIPIDLGLLAPTPIFEGGDHSSALGINRFGQIVGASTPPNQESAFLYANGAMVNLDPPYAPDQNDPAKIFTPFSVAWAINDLGQIGGAATIPPPPNSLISPFHAVLFRLGLQPIDLGTLGGDESFGRSMNSAGQLVGYSLLPGNATQHAALFVVGGSPIDLDGLPSRASAAIAINDAGTIVGWARPAGAAEHAVRWQAGQMVDLTPSLSPGLSSDAFGINIGGDIVGSVGISRSSTHAALWHNGQMTDIGTLGGLRGEAWGINSSGQIVGDSLTSGSIQHAFVYSSGKMVDLNTLLAPNSGWELRVAFAINDNGQIVGEGIHNGQLRGFLFKLQRCSVDVVRWGQGTPYPWASDHYDHSFVTNAYASPLLSRISLSGALELVVGTDPPIPIRLSDSQNNLVGLRTALQSINDISTSDINIGPGGYMLSVYNNKCLSRACSFAENNLSLIDLSAPTSLLTPRSMSSAGCLLTALAMSMNFAKVSAIPIQGTLGVDLNPGTLNLFMSNTLPGMTAPGGVFNGTGSVRLHETVMAMRSQLNKTLDFVPLAGDSRNDLWGALQILNDNVCAADPHPVIVGVRGTDDNDSNFPSHFVIVTGKEDRDPIPRYNIVDPGHANRTSLDDYSNAATGQPEFQLRGIVKDPPGDASTLGINVSDTAELMIIDNLGRRTGFDPVSKAMLHEIPNVAYFVDAIADPATGEQVTGVSHELDFPSPSVGLLTLVVSGLRNEIYSVSVRPYASNGDAEQEVVLKGIAALGSTSTFRIQYVTAPGTTSTASRIATFASTLDDITNSLQLGLIDKAGIANSLSQKIRAAQSAGSASSNILRAFKDEVSAQSGKHITGVAVSTLLEDADSLLTLKGSN
jgi:probable HAF family extracellular repeat protein